LSEKLVYDSFNKIKFKFQAKNEVNELKKESISSSDLVIAYCLFDEKNINIVKEKILWPENI
jgi:hypothetical protein